MNRGNGRKKKKRKCKVLKKWLFLTCFVCIVFLVCLKLETWLYAPTSVLAVEQIQEKNEEEQLLQKNEEIPYQEGNLEAFLTLLIGQEQVGLGNEFSCLYVEEDTLKIEEQQAEQWYMRDYAIHCGSLRQIEGTRRNRETFYGLIGTTYTEYDFSNYYNFINQFYIVDTSTSAVKSLFDGNKLKQVDMTLEKNLEEPQILIYHTHSLEAFCDSREGVEEDTIVGVGNYLTEILTKQYGYRVLHDKTAYDLNQYGYGDRDNAYQRATLGLEEILKQYPSIEVVIDLHRDSRALTTAIVDGKEMAQIMLFNGLCRSKAGPYSKYTNEYLSENLALSLQMHLLGESLYPDVMRKIYLKSDQYNMHFRAHSLLVEVGTEQNTVEQAKNAMEVFADILNEVLTLK